MSRGKTVTTRATPRSKPDVASRPTFNKPGAPQPVAIPPTRAHSSAYHYPLLIEHESAGKELLGWFESIEEARNMPWRKNWLDPEQYEGGEEEFGKSLEKRAYEVWVSEVMLQQTRVSTVIPYFNNWISKWPTVEALAEASHDDVLSVWKGLGYYSRATRLHEGAKVVVSAKTAQACKVPSSVDELQKIPGIGRYTAGAVSSIAFGRAEPVLDGNVARVLSRQLGLYVDAKDKKSTDVLWEVADSLVKSMASHPPGGRSKIPGQWNQALMELGSTICTPRPKCEECPIRGTCRVYAEGATLSSRKTAMPALPDIEDACTLCLNLDTEDLATAPDSAPADEDDADDAEVSAKPAKRRKTEPKQANTISNYFASRTPKPKPEPKPDLTPTPTADSGDDNLSDAKRKSPLTTPAQQKAIATYCSLFPKKVPKKAVPEEDAVVCIVEAVQSASPSRWLIEQRPAKGLLASLWQFPQSTVPENSDSQALAAAAKSHVGTLSLSPKSVREVGSLLHVFTHLKLTMHVFHVEVEAEDGKEGVEVKGKKWVEEGEMGDATLSTGMRRCWEMLGRGY